MTLPMTTCRYLRVLLVTFLTTFCVVEGQNGAPEIILAPTGKKVAENGVVSFFCKASGIPPPDIHWRKGGKRIMATTHRYRILPMPQGMMLRIEEVKFRKDNGVFECVAENGVGAAATAAAKLEVYPEGQVPDGYPRITESPTLKAVARGYNTVMLCSAVGIPEPIISWLKDYMPVNTTDPRLRLLPTGSLQIRQSQETDEGKYECVAENSAGVVYSYAANLYVRVRRVPPHFSIPPESVEVMPGGAVNLTCVAIGSPMPHVKWRLGSLELTPEDNIPIGKNVLRLSDIRESGRYTCVATSELGNIEADAEVRVKVPGGAPSNFTAIGVSSTSVRLEWDPPSKAHRNGEIVLYEISYHKKYEPNADRTMNTTERSIMVEGLETTTDYIFQIRVYTSLGAGPWSNRLPFRTFRHSAPPGPYNVKVRRVSPTALEVTWDPPHYPGVVGYRVYYKMHVVEDMEAWQSIEIGPFTVQEIAGLEPNSVYAVRVRARLSDGRYSDYSSVATSNIAKKDLRTEQYSKKFSL